MFPGVTYNVKIPKAAISLLSADIAWSFTVRTEDVVRPKVMYLDPEQKKVGKVNSKVPLAVVFSEMVRKRECQCNSRRRFAKVAYCYGRRPRA